jgi:hypothetical protein
MRHSRGILCRLGRRLLTGKFFCHLLTALQLSRNQKGRGGRRRLLQQFLKSLGGKVLQGIFLFKY